MAEFDDILNDLILVANGTIQVNYDAKEHTKQRIKTFMQNLVWESEISEELSPIAHLGKRAAQLEIMRFINEL